MGYASNMDTAERIGLFTLRKRLDTMLLDYWKRMIITR